MENRVTDMASYDYRCGCCEHEFEAEQAVNDPPLTECPSCRVCALVRQVSGGTSFVLKGDGWARDGYATKKGGTL